MSSPGALWRTEGLLAVMAGSGSSCQHTRGALGGCEVDFRDGRQLCQWTKVVESYTHRKVIWWRVKYILVKPCVFFTFLQELFRGSRLYGNSTDLLLVSPLPVFDQNRVSLTQKYPSPPVGPYFFSSDSKCIPGHLQLHHFVRLFWCCC